MGESAKAKDKEPGFPTTPVEVYSNEGDKQQGKKGMEKYPTIAEDISEEELTYGFIHDIREKGGDKQNPYIYAVHERGKLPYPTT